MLQAWTCGASLLANRGQLLFHHIVDDTAPRPHLGRARPHPTPRAYIGCSGWSYPDWRGTVYPPGLRQKDWFAHYATLFKTVEVNNTFYRLPPPETFRTWATQAPPGFVYALKVSSFGTHRLKLTSPERWLPPYLERAVLLGPALGPNLVQLPPHWKRDTKRLADFLEAASATGAAKVEEAAGAAAGAGPVRWTVELRDPSWLHESTYQVLTDHKAALCWHDLLPDHPWLLTTDWAYARFHGPAAPIERYAGQYGEQGLTGAARRLLASLQDGFDIYAYFNNDQGGAAVRDAAVLARLVASN